jgi:hypothetical protein
MAPSNGGDDDEPAMNDSTPPTNDPDEAPAPDVDPPSQMMMEMMMGNPPAGGGVPILPDLTGWVQGDTNTVGIQGAWYSYNDCKDSPSDCTENHLPLEGGFDNIDGKMCTSGTTAAVMAETEFSSKWGAGIALDLNALGGLDTGKNPWDATANGVKGFAFTIEFNTPGAVRVNLPTTSTEVASHFTEVSTSGAQQVLWGDVQQGSWIKGPERVEFDPTTILSLQFQVPTKMKMPVPFDFCVSNLSAIQ